jgi:hypothetical protein
MGDRNSKVGQMLNNVAFTLERLPTESGEQVAAPLSTKEKKTRSRVEKRWSIFPLSRQGPASATEMSRSHLAACVNPKQRLGAGENVDFFGLVQKENERHVSSQRVLL